MFKCAEFTEKGSYTSESFPKKNKQKKQIQAFWQKKKFTVRQSTVHSHKVDMPVSTPDQK